VITVCKWKPVWGWLQALTTAMNSLSYVKREW